MLHDLTKFFIIDKYKPPTKNRIMMEEVYLKFAEIIAIRSTCIRNKNGAVITSTDLSRVFSVGYNGAPHKVKHDCTGKEGSCKCLHSEINALLKKHVIEEGILFCTSSPCMTCARYILQCNIKTVFYINEYRDKEPIDFLRKYGITIIKL